MKGIFVTGTDTGIGKTIVTGFLGRYLSESGLNVITQKWVSAGGSDIKAHLKLMGEKSVIRGSGFGVRGSGYLKLMEEKPDIPISYLCPYSFKLSASPHFAARAENIEINPDVIKEAFLFLKCRFSIVIVEGSGGLFVPITRDKFLIDIARELSLSVLLVSKNRLGTINHTILTIEALKARNMEILGIVFNNGRKEKKEILEDNPKIIKDLTKANIFGILPFIKEKDKLYKAFIPIGERIKRNLSFII